MTEVAVRAKNWLDNERVTRAFQVIAVVSLLIGLGVGVQQARLTSCLAVYNDAANANSQLRAAAAAEERSALDELISSIDEARSVPLANGRTALDLAFRSYAEQRARIEGKREVMPIPAPPSQTCG